MSCLSIVSQKESLFLLGHSVIVSKWQASLQSLKTPDTLLLDSPFSIANTIQFLRINGWL